MCLVSQGRFSKLPSDESVKTREMFADETLKSFTFLHFHATSYPVCCACVTLRTNNLCNSTV